VINSKTSGKQTFVGRDWTVEFPSVSS